MTKQEARTYFLQQRKNLDASTLQKWNAMWIEQVLAFLDPLPRNIHVFLPIQDKHEPDTFLLLNELEKRGMKNIIVPVVAEDGTLHHKRCELPVKVSVSKWGIPEPTEGTEVAPTDVDVVLVPMLAFDFTGHRVGFGKGYYDRFLAECRSDCKRMGISFFEPIDKLIDVNETDIPLHHCFTPKARYDFV